MFALGLDSHDDSRPPLRADSTMKMTPHLLLPNQEIRVEERLVSSNGFFTLTLQSDGNIVVSRVQTSQSLWRAGTTGKPIERLIMQRDANLVAYGANGVAYWNTHTSRRGAYNAFLILQDDGNLMMYDKNGYVLWGTGAAINLSLPTIVQEENGYTFNEVSETWKSIYSTLPCCKALVWPGCETAIYEDVVEGHGPVLIQVWKGFEPKYMGLSSMPGGFGAQVGVYRRLPGKTIPTSIPALPESLSHWIIQTANSVPSRDLWWPAPELEAQLEFTLRDPLKNQVVVQAPPQRGFWVAKWMEDKSFCKFACYKMEGKQPPTTSWILDFSVNGVKRTWPEPAPDVPVGEVKDFLPGNMGLLAQEVIQGNVY